MKTKLFATLSLIVIVLTLLSACGAAAPQESGVFVEESRAEPANDFGFAGAGEAEKSAAPMPTSGVVVQTVPDVANAPRQAASVDRKIIKNAEVNVLVKDSDTAIDLLTQVVGDAGGYIVSSRVWYQTHRDGENYKYASITLGVPVDQFEVTMRRVRGLAIRVTDENASGEDVTDQFVDLESRLANLEATQVYQGRRQQLVALRSGIPLAQ